MTWVVYDEHCAELLRTEPTLKLVREWAAAFAGVSSIHAVRVVQGSSLHALRSGADTIVVAWRIDETPSHLGRIARYPSRKLPLYRLDNGNKEIAESILNDNRERIDIPLGRSGPIIVTLYDLGWSAAHIARTLGTAKGFVCRVLANPASFLEREAA